MLRIRNQVVAVALLTVVMALLAGPVSAGKPSMSGTIELNAAEAAAAVQWPAYNDTVGFTTTVDGKVGKNGRVYITVACRQESGVVYQWSASPDFQFPLEDQPGQGLEWDGGAAACDAALIYREAHGKNVTIEFLATTHFDVAGA